jgi:hypothetical protein
LKNFGRVIEEKNKIPKEIKEKIGSQLFQNIIFAVIIFVYLGALNLGMANIPTENYLMDLKVFSFILLAITIIFFELAYNKDKSELWLHGIEIMGVSIFTVYLIYFYSIYYNTFGNILFSFAFVYFLYYAIKIIIMRRKTIKNYKNLTDIGEIVKKKE